MDRCISRLEFVFGKILHWRNTRFAHRAEEGEWRVQYNTDVAGIAGVLSCIAERDGPCAFPKPAAHTSYRQVHNTQHAEHASAVVGQRALHQGARVVESLVQHNHNDYK